MKKKWVISSIVVAAIGSTMYFFRKKNDEDTNAKSTHRVNLISFFEGKSYKVHCYNEKNDFILFHPTRNEKKHVFYEDGESTKQTFQKKLDSYFYNFTNHFYFIANDQHTLESIRQSFHDWSITLDSETINKYGNPHADFQTADAVLSNKDDNWYY